MDTSIIIEPSPLNGYWKVINEPQISSPVRTFLFNILAVFDNTTLLMAPMEVTTKSLVKGRLPDLRSEEDKRTVTPTIKELTYLRQLCRWNRFEYEARNHYRNQEFSLDILGYTSPEGEYDMSREERVLCGNESSVVGRFGQHVGQVMTTIFEKTYSLQDFGFGDFKTYRNSRDLKTCPDIAVVQEGKLLLVGEAKTSWLLQLDGDDYNDKNGAHFRTLLGQICDYMNDLELKYGFLTTYEQTIFLKRETHPKSSSRKHDLVLWHSPVIYHDTSSGVPGDERDYRDYRKKVSLRQCLLYFVSLAQEESQARNAKNSKPSIGQAMEKDNYPSELDEPQSSDDRSSSDDGSSSTDERARYDAEREKKDRERQANRRPRR